MSRKVQAAHLSREAKRSGASGAGRETASDEFGIVLGEGLPAAEDPVAVERIEFAYRARRPVL